MQVRALRGAEGGALREAPPATPVAVLGWRELPAAGDQVLEVASEVNPHALSAPRLQGGNGPLRFFRNARTK